MIDHIPGELAVKPEDKEESYLDLGEEYTQDKKDNLDDDKKDELDLDDNHDMNTNNQDDHEDNDEDDKSFNKNQGDEKDNFKTEIAECESKYSVMHNSIHSVA